MSVLIVSGTDTGVGKTIVTAAVAALAAARGASVAVVKPAQTGVTEDQASDLDEVKRLAGVTDTFELVRYPDPLAPAAAARLTRAPALDVGSAAQHVRALAERYRLVLVEGTGGLLVRYDDEGATIADLAHRLDAPVLVVTRPNLGALNHAALTLESIATHGLELAGLVIGSWPAEPDLACRSNIRDLEMLAARPLAGALPAGAAGIDAPEFLLIARRGLAPMFGGMFNPAEFRREFDPGGAQRWKGLR